MIRSTALQPRFQGENLPHDLTLVELLRKVAEQKGLSVAQLAIAWVLSAARTSSRWSGAGFGDGTGDFVSTGSAPCCGTVPLSDQARRRAV